jgi:hypothetical protein
VNESPQAVSRMRFKGGVVEARVRKPPARGSAASLVASGSILWRRRMRRSWAIAGVAMLLVQPLSRSALAGDERNSASRAPSESPGVAAAIPSWTACA